MLAGFTRGTAGQHSIWHPARRRNPVEGCLPARRIQASEENQDGVRMAMPSGKQCPVSGELLRLEWGTFSKELARIRRSIRRRRTASSGCSGARANSGSCWPLSARGSARARALPPVSSERRTPTCAPVEFHTPTLLSGPPFPLCRGAPADRPEFAFGAMANTGALVVWCRGATVLGCLGETWEV